MIWSPIIPVPAKGAGAPRSAAVCVGSQAKSLRTSPSLLIMLRPYLLADAPSWLRAGETLKALLGGGEHAGMIRLEPSGAFALGRTAANAPGKPVLRLRLPLPPGVAAEKRKPAHVEFDYADGWLEITLPAWARVTGAATPAAPIASGNATPPARGAALAAAAAELARRKAGL
jgi:hypothetical protein